MSIGDYAPWQACYCLTCTTSRQNGFPTYTLPIRPAEEMMSEDQAPYLEKPDPPIYWRNETHYGSPFFDPKELDRIEGGVSDDPFGAKAVINAAYDLALASGTHPVQCIKAAYAAAMAHAESYEYINMSSKTSEVAEYRMVQKREGKNV